MSRPTTDRFESIKPNDAPTTPTQVSGHDFQVGINEYRAMGGSHQALPAGMPSAESLLSGEKDAPKDKNNSTEHYSANLH